MTKEVKDSVIVGMHCGYEHDSGASVIVNGAIKAAVAEERVSRKKKDQRFPLQSLMKCLEIAELHISEVTHFCFAARDIVFQPNPGAYMAGEGETLFSGLRNSSSSNSLFWMTRHYRLNRLLGLRPFEKEVKRVLYSKGANESARFQFIDHHTCHMASVFFTSGHVKADDGYVFCVDAYGDGASVSGYYFDSFEQLPNTLHKMSSWLSPGAMYSSTTQFLGMKSNRHEGKVTGLAAYGDSSRLFEKTKKYLYYNEKAHTFEVDVLDESKIIRYCKKIMDIWKGVESTGGGFDEMSNDFSSETKENIAAAVQERLDNEIVKYVSDVIGDKAPGCILLAGGVFANVKTNGAIAKKFPDAEVVIHPAMTDEGVALGAALYGDYCAKGHVNVQSLDHVYLGSNYDPLISRWISEVDDRFKIYDLSNKDKLPESEVARLISKGNVIGLFQGGMEYGPRALGNRSILIDPRKQEVNDVVNKRLNRTEYMPFAPAVMEEFSSDIFDISPNVAYTCNFMTIVVDVKRKWRDRIPAVVHVDNTARPQLVSEASNKNYYHIIKEFYKITDVPVLVNTSFNIHEEPIVESPSDALRALELDAIDAIYFPPYLVVLRSNDPYYNTGS